MRQALSTPSSPSFFAEWRSENDTSFWAGVVFRRRRVAAGGMLLAAGAVAAGVLIPSGAASADPTSNTWYRLRMCESSNNYAINTGNGYYGAYQFDLSTWRSVGGSGYPNQASKAEQDARALMLYRMRGWQPWTCASILGLQEDGDARSGRTGDISVPGGGMRPTPPTSSPKPPSGDAVPAFPGGSHWYVYGETSSQIKRFQDQMHKRGYFPVGTGEYGPNTLRMVKQLQRLNGLEPNGYIGPNTWKLAWTGRYRTPSSSTPAPTPKPEPTPPPTPKPRPTTAPAFPGGSHWYTYGEWNRHIKLFQDQMHKRGYFPVGTGEYGPNTLRMVKRLQRLNGLVPNGYIGPNTWKLAWTGKY